jgi:hypothetical protein
MYWARTARIEGPNIDCVHVIDLFGLFIFLSAFSDFRIAFKELFRMLASFISCKHPFVKVSLGLLLRISLYSN